MTLHRIFRLAAVLIFAVAGVTAWGSDAIPAPKTGVSAGGKGPHVTAELIAETTHIRPGEPFLVALHLHMDPGWHTYWINPGDAGLATMIKWTLQPEFTAGPIQWPVPEIHMMGGLTTYGYGGDVYLLTTITPTGDVTKLPGPSEIKAKAEWLVCQEECIPGKAELSFKVDWDGTKGGESADTAAFFAAARARLPVANTRWDIDAYYGACVSRSVSLTPPVFNMTLHEKADFGMPFPKSLTFFPEQPNVLDNNIKNQEGGLGINGDIYRCVKLEQNGEKPDHLSGVLVSDEPLESGGVKAVYLSSFAVGSHPSSFVSPPNPTAAGTTTAVVATPTPSSTATNAPTTGAAPSASATAASEGMQAAVGSSVPVPEAPPFLGAVLGAAFLGGLILNLMPCVLPVLSLKVFSLVRHAGEHPGSAWKQGVAFTVGVVISFWVLAGLLLALREAGSHIGWGFQMQSPGFVAALILLFFVLGLNLFGVFELGTSLAGLDAKATSRVGSGLASSFLNGALATLAATPCTAPFMGSSLGFAAEQPPFVDLLIFTFLALGMASPYLLLTAFPGALRFVPKPGAWMEAVKQFMGFLLMGTVIFLVYVFGALAGQEQIPALLGVLLLASVAAWIYGRWGGPGHEAGARFAALALAILILCGAIRWVVVLANATPPSVTATAAQDGWQAWSPAAVDQALGQGRPVFVDFTAAWCLSCKVNEQVALESSEVKQAFKQKNVALFRADWTHQDASISETLMRYHRDGVPLYLLYSPKAKDAPQVLPEVLTPGIVTEALGKL